MENSSINIFTKSENNKTPLLHRILVLRSHSKLPAIPVIAISQI